MHRMQFLLHSALGIQNCNAREKNMQIQTLEFFIVLISILPQVPLR